MSQSQSETWTIGRLLTWTADYLKQHGASSPRLDAEVLLAMAAGCQRIDLYTRFDEPAPEALRTSFRELVRRRAEGMPVAYLVGRREFYSLSFRVTPDVLIPRPETELLVVALLDRARRRRAAGAERGRRRYRLGHHRRVRRQVSSRGPHHGHRHQSAGAGRGPRQCRRFEVCRANRTGRG